jgi:enoyl-CoA hydratase/carnithine racemase/AcrR family transcriptional regulator
MMDEIIAAFDRTDADDSVRAVIFTGHGERAFCAGADLTPQDGSAVFSDPTPVADLSDPRVRDGGGKLTLRLFESKKPIIGAINGVAVGVGATMQLPMDIRLASDTARFGFVFARRGIVPEACSSWFLPKIVGLPQALEWTMTGRVFDAQEALRGGLVRSLHAPADLIPAATALAREIADNTSAVSVAMTRAMLWRLPWGNHPMTAHRIDSRAIYRLSKGADMAEGVQSLVGRSEIRMNDVVPLQADSPGARAQLLETASAIMREGDIVDISLSELSLRSGLNSALVKYYFGNKAGLMKALLDRDMAAITHTVDALLRKDMDPEAKLTLHLGKMVDTYYATPYLNRLLMRLVRDSDPEEAKRIAETYLTPLQEAYDRLIAEGVRAGVFRPVDPQLFYFSATGAADRFFSARLVLRHCFDQDTLTAELRDRYKAHIIDLIMAGIRAT